MAFTVKQSNPAAATAADLYTVPSATEAVISTLAVAEHGGAGATFDVLIRPAGAGASGSSVLIKGGQLDANDTVFFTIGIALAATDVVTVEADTGDVTFTAFVNESEV